ncbi:MAG: hypothetical protein KJN64_08550 [Ignavibacteria bacterium]|nr:hypothetical protein [Ignavibacteria bacterium]MBT8380868.1 hypothetical protein [Ignavibacteria bacterium]NNJ54268.1 hypothetical protein [Ignavibacteriaceae bacterium]NNL20233.1 hypothetical protein [Ignavibacteriaceae bacterium]
MTYNLLLVFSFTLLLGCSANISKYDSVKPDEQYPRWLQTEDYRTSQTSGIAFIGEDVNGSDEFLLADDIGKIHRLIISKDTIFTFTEINFSEEVQAYINNFPKMDFEEITYDQFTKEVYISIEGNGADFLQYNGIYKLRFEDDNIKNNSVVGIEKIEIYPEEIFTNYVKENIGYEGYAVSENYLFLGLEAILNPDKSFSNNTLVLVVTKNDLEIVKQFYTEDYKIGTICGLYAESDSVVWGIDRNNRTLFNLKFNDSLRVISQKLIKLKTIIPNYNKFEYTGSLESLTMNKSESIFLIDDPWFSRFIPDSTTLQQLDDKTVANFKEFIPIMYKLNLE